LVIVRNKHNYIHINDIIISEIILLTTLGRKLNFDYIINIAYNIV